MQPIGKQCSNNSAILLVKNCADFCTKVRTSKYVGKGGGGMVVYLPKNALKKKFFYYPHNKIFTNI